MGHVVGAANEEAQERRIAGQRELGRGERPRPGIGDLQQAGDEAVAVLSERILEPLPVVAAKPAIGRTARTAFRRRERACRNGWPAKALPVWVQPRKAPSSKSQVGVCAQAQDAVTNASAKSLIWSEISIRSSQVFAVYIKSQRCETHQYSSWQGHWPQTAFEGDHDAAGIGRRLRASAAFDPGQRGAADDVLACGPAPIRKPQITWFGQGVPFGRAAISFFCCPRPRYGAREITLSEISPLSCGH